ncbi:MAG: UDP-N-acetylmuramoyl-tripeptide--D-alanyl-D-alanine ligase [Muribaculaceae bacterium]|nr:UDP-N-acetylmuramoyl-tripeptide--D-alanyl-D-alanine ligase [Muribaculaceae bacterium]
MSIYLLVIYIVCGCYFLYNFKSDIHILQQNSYRVRRYWRWLEQGNFMPGWRLVDLAMTFLLMSTLLNTALSALLAAIVCVIKIMILARKKYKKPLVITNRVKRIFSVTWILALIPYLALIYTIGRQGESVGFYSGPRMVLAIMFLLAVVSWAFVIAAVWILTPVEKSINKKYWNEASAILESKPELKVIGITGSYGKTSTKHYLHTILSEQFETLMTPGSYNTPMGVIRTVREMMQPYTEVFICEMGAKQKGDIKEICDLVHPQYGIITAVGPMHLETFGSIDNVRNTKFELADAIPADGCVIVNNDFEQISGRNVDNTRCIRYAVSNVADADYRVENIRYTPDGSEFTVIAPDGSKFEFTTKLIGECNISNLLAAIIMALKLGMDIEKIRLGVKRIEQVEHRLSIKRTPGGVTIIDDAFNSNPVGSKMALEVLGGFKSGKRICITPGMIELGSSRDELNTKLGEHAGNNSDIVIIVNEYNRDALTQGVLSTGFNKENLHFASSFEEAQKILSGLLAPGDVVLYENDLPDSFK